MSEWQLIEAAPLPEFDAAKYFSKTFRCLTASQYGHMKCATYSFTSRGKGRWMDDGGYVCVPTHWMPLPKPPVKP